MELYRSSSSRGTIVCKTNVGNILPSLRHTSTSSSHTTCRITLSYAASFSCLWRYQSDDFKWSSTAPAQCKFQLQAVPVENQVQHGGCATLLKQPQGLDFAVCRVEQKIFDASTHNGGSLLSLIWGK